MRDSWRWLTLVSVLAVTGCSNAAGASSSEDASVAALTSSKPVIDEDEAHDRAVDVVADQSFDEVADTGQCTDDCSGHDAGFQWAKENGVIDSSECDGKSGSFVEGCEAYAQAVDEQAEEEQRNPDDET